MTLSATQRIKSTAPSGPGGSAAAFTVTDHMRFLSEKRCLRGAPDRTSRPPSRCYFHASNPK